MPAMFMLGIAAVVLPLLGNCLEIDPVHCPDRYAADGTFRATFLYELGWNLALVAFLVWLGGRRQVRARGLFALYVAGYSGFRIVEELLCAGPANHVFGLRLNFCAATVVCASGLAWFVRTQRPASDGSRAPVRPRSGSAG